jgi:hypothetical protein
VLFGLGSGALAGLIYVHMGCRSVGQRKDCLNVGRGLIVPLSAVAGIIGDLFLREFDTVFERPATSGRVMHVAPLVQRSRAGAMVAVGF